MPSQFTTIVILFTVLAILTISLMVTRLYHRWSRKCLRISDALTLAALVLLLVYCALVMMTTVAVLDSDGKLLYRSSSHWAFFALNLISGVLVLLSKCCILQLLLEVEPEAHRRTWLKALMWLLSCQIFAGFMCNFFGCYLLYAHAYWAVLSPNVPIPLSSGASQSKCMPRKHFVLVNGILTAVFECIIMWAAISIALRVKASTLQRLGLIFTFSLGLLTIAASACSTLTIWDNSIDHPNETISDIQYNYYVGTIWVCLEVFLGLSIGSVLPIRSVLVSAMHAVMEWPRRALFAHSHKHLKPETDVVFLRETGNVKDEEIMVMTNIEPRSWEKPL